MKNIILICSAGITSSLIVQKMQEASSDLEPKINVWSSGVATAREEIEKADIVLLSPPAAYLEDIFEDLVSGKVAVKVIPSELYTIKSGKEIIELALSE